jgi:hypothetical protein
MSDKIEVTNAQPPNSSGGSGGSGSSSYSGPVVKSFEEFNLLQSPATR